MASEEIGGLNGLRGRGEDFSPFLNDQSSLCDFRPESRDDSFLYGKFSGLASPCSSINGFTQAHFGLNGTYMSQGGKQPSFTDLSVPAAFRKHIRHSSDGSITPLPDQSFSEKKSSHKSSFDCMLNNGLHNNFTDKCKYDWLNSSHAVKPLFSKNAAHKDNAVITDAQPTDICSTHIDSLQTKDSMSKQLQDTQLLDVDTVSFSSACSKSSSDLISNYSLSDSPAPSLKQFPRPSGTHPMMPSDLCAKDIDHQTSVQSIFRHKKENGYNPLHLYPWCSTYRNSSGSDASMKSSGRTSPPLPVFRNLNSCFPSHLKPPSPGAMFRPVSTSSSSSASSSAAHTAGELMSDGGGEEGNKSAANRLSPSSMSHNGSDL